MTTLTWVSGWKVSNAVVNVLKYKDKGGRGPTCFQATSVSLIWGGGGGSRFWLLASCLNTRNSARGFWTGFITVTAEQIRWDRVQHRSIVQKEQKRCTLWRGPCFTHVGNSHLSPSFRRAQKNLPLDDREDVFHLHDRCDWVGSCSVC